MHTRAHRFLAVLALALAPTTGLAFDDDLDFEDDDFFDEVSRDKKNKDSRRSDDEDLGDELGADPIEGGGDDPEWDAPIEPEIIDDPVEGFEDPGIGEDPDEGFGTDPDEGFGEDPDEGFGEDPPSDARTAAVSGSGRELAEDPLDDFPADKPARKPAPVAKAPAKPAGPARLSLKTSDKDPLSGAFPAGVVAVDVDAVVVELPVLVARSGSDFDGGDFWLVAEIEVGGKKVGESRQLVTKAGVADLGPTVVWMKQHVPVVEAKGDVTVKVSRIDGEDPPSALFTKKAPYKL